LVRGYFGGGGYSKSLYPKVPNFVPPNIEIGTKC
jgi:hypothetical protein